MSKKKDKTPEYAPTPAPAEEAATQQTEAPAANSGVTVTKPDQKTINVVGGVVIATLVAIVIAQAVGDNNQLSSNQVRLPNGQFQTPGQQGAGGMQGSGGMQGPGQMQGPGGAQAPGVGPQGSGDWNSDGQDSDSGNQRDDNDDRGGTSQNDAQPAPNSRAS